MSVNVAERSVRVKNAGRALITLLFHDLLRFCFLAQPRQGIRSSKMFDRLHVFAGERT